MSSSTIRVRSRNHCLHTVLLLKVSLRPSWACNKGILWAEACIPSKNPVSEAFSVPTPGAYIAQFAHRKVVAVALLRTTACTASGQKLAGRSLLSAVPSQPAEVTPKRRRKGYHKGVGWADTVFDGIISIPEALNVPIGVLLVTDLAGRRVAEGLTVLSKCSRPLCSGI